MSETITAAPAAPAAPAATPAPSAAPAAPAVPAPAAWHSSLDQETLGWAQNRGLDKLDQAGALLATIKQARELEKLRGAPADRLIQLPADPSLAGSMDPVYARLGRPATADGYKLEMAVEDAAEADAVVKALAPSLHAAGLSQSQFNAVFKAVSEYAAKLSQESASATEAQAAANMAKLKQEWGSDFDANLVIAKRTAQKLGVDAETVDALEAALGSNTGVVKLFARIGAGSAEAAFVGGQAPLGVGTAAGAEARIAELRKDPEFSRRYLAGDAEAVRTMKNLTLVAAGAA